MTYLLDTSVVSETRKAIRDPGVTAWIRATPADSQFLSVLTVGEIGRGIARLGARRDREQAATLQRWLDGLVTAFAGRVVTITSEVAREWVVKTPDTRSRRWTACWAPRPSSTAGRWSPGT